MQRPEHISLLARENEAKRLTEERVVREGEAAFRRVKEDGPSGIIEYGYKFRPVIECLFSCIEMSGRFINRIHI